MMDMTDCSRNVFVKGSEEVDEVIKGFEYEIRLALSLLLTRKINRSDLQLNVI